ncbi:hypothetical protein FS815_24525 [Agrobacterium vitis]|uniref:hypothetical protein n=1 Tax=Allorhizobium ampelinum TaxID=3025782 RepID=UPI001F3429E8|nr:hypothetical protein [Allorhizobium ampelinum]MCF1449959.1 hypothetical protein [Allorhizobium ampelinum]
MTAKKISIIGQISEIEREIALREQHYPRLVREGKMREEARVMMMDRILAIRATLMFCQQHEADIREFIAAKKAGKAVSA